MVTKSLLSIGAEAVVRLNVLRARSKLQELVTCLLFLIVLLSQCAIFRLRQ